MTTWFDRVGVNDVFDPFDNPVPYEQRLSFWRRTKARLEERRRERAEQEARENMDISKWLAEKAPTSGELVAQGTVDAVRFYPEYPYLRHVHIGADGVTIFEGEMDLMRSLHPAPISSARRTPTRDAVIEKIRTNTVDVEPVLDVAEMIVAHRNGATALERPMTIDEQCESPVWEELVERMWDPTHERGPRERDWVRQQHKRQQPERQSRAQRKGKR